MDSSGQRRIACRLLSSGGGARSNGFGGSSPHETVNSIYWITISMFIIKVII